MPTATVWRDTLLAVLAVSALPLLGVGALAWHEQAARRAVPGLVSVGVGALLGAACFQLIPESLAGAADAAARRAVPVSVLAGYGVFFLLEWLLHGAHGHHDPRRAAHAHDAPAGTRGRALVALNLAGDGLHNLLDGMLIAATFLTDPAVGVLTTLAVSLHEVPRELGSFGVFVHGGATVRRALAYNAVTALLAGAGAALTLAAGAHTAGLARALLPFAAGNFLYVAGALVGPLLRRPGSPRALAVRVGLLGLGLAATGLPALLH